MSDHASEGHAVAGESREPTGVRPDRGNDLTKEYEAEGITVQWYARRCIHSARCVGSLPMVFNPRRKPWIEAEAASPDEIAATVLRCPSGALHFMRHDGGEQESPDVPATAVAMPNGPLYVRGDLEVRAPDGTLLRRDTRASLCRCGLAAKSLFCDDSCRKSGWREGGATG